MLHVLVSVVYVFIFQENCLFATVTTREDVVRFAKDDVKEADRLAVADEVKRLDDEEVALFDGTETPETPDMQEALWEALGRRDDGDESLDKDDTADPVPSRCDIPEVVNLWKDGVLGGLRALSLFVEGPISHKQSQLSMMQLSEDPRAGHPNRVVFVHWVWPKMPLVADAAHLIGRICPIDVHGKLGYAADLNVGPATSFKDHTMLVPRSPHVMHKKVSDRETIEVGSTIHRAKTMWTFMLNIEARALCDDPVPDDDDSTCDICGLVHLGAEEEGDDHMVRTWISLAQRSVAP